MQLKLGKKIKVCSLVFVLCLLSAKVSQSTEILVGGTMVCTIDDQHLFNTNPRQGRSDAYSDFGDKIEIGDQYLFYYNLILGEYSGPVITLGFKSYPDQGYKGLHYYSGDGNNLFSIEHLSRVFLLKYHNHSVSSAKGFNKFFEIYVGPKELSFYHNFKGKSFNVNRWGGNPWKGTWEEDSDILDNHLEMYQFFCKNQKGNRVKEVYDALKEYQGNNKLKDN